MRRCTTCGLQWDTAETRCPHDGAPLVAVDVRVMSARSPSKTWSTQVPALAVPRVAPDDELVPGMCVGEYVIERKIGIGGMGVVYGARHPVIGKRAAIKILNARLSLDDEAVSRFVLEAQAVNKIGHANIVDIFSFGVLDDGRSYFAMEWLQGETLGQRLARGRLASREAIVILAALCRALEAAHAAGVIHRDLKPDNVFLTTDDEGWRVKLLDFGIAKLSTPTTSISRTATGVAVGTPLYMAPEQARGEAVDGRTDVYALGLVAYTMVCGESLFQDEGSAVEILAAHITKPPTSPRAHVPDISAAFEQLILDMIAKQPGERPAVVEVRRQLTVIAAALAHPAPALQPPPGPVTERASAEQLQQLRPPEMPTEALPQAPQVPSAAPALPTPAPQIAMAGPEAVPDPIPDTMDDDDAIAPRRARWPVAIIAAALLTASAALIVAISHRATPSPSRIAPAEPAPPPVATTQAARPASPPPPAPVAAADVARPASPPPPTPVAATIGPAPPAPAAGAIPPRTPGTAELVVEPGLAHLAIDDHPVTLVDGRAALALSPGEHVAIATLGARSTRRQFTVTADHRAKVSLQVPAADASAAPPNRPPVSEDVDAVHDPFHR